MANIIDLSKQVPILDFEHNLEPLWGDGSGRNSKSGTFSGTFRGYFSQCVINFGHLTQAQMDIVTSNFEVSIFSMTYPTKDGTTKTENFYGTKLSGKKKSWNGLYEPFSLTLTGVKKYR